MNKEGLLLFTLLVLHCKRTTTVPNAELGEIFIASIPPVATIFENGDSIGVTNLSVLKFAEGSHCLRFVKDGCIRKDTFNIIAGKNPSQMVKICDKDAISVRQSDNKLCIKNNGLSPIKSKLVELMQTTTLDLNINCDNNNDIISPESEVCVKIDSIMGYSSEADTIAIFWWACIDSFSIQIPSSLNQINFCLQ